MEKTTVLAMFKIFADQFPVDEISNVLEIESTDYVLKGQKGKYTLAKETIWYISTRLSESLDINEHLREIICLLQTKEHQLLDLRNKYQLNYMFSIVVNIKENIAPSMYLEHNVIDFAHSIRAEFDFDVYVS